MTLEQMKRSRAGMKSRVTLLIKDDHTIISTGDAAKIDAHRHNIEHFLVRIEALDELIIAELSIEKEVDEEVCSIAVYRHDVLEAIETLRRATSSTGATPKPQRGKFTKLPKINLPNFSGDHLEWNAFWDLFNQSIHLNPDLDAVEKSSYLRGKLKGDAIKLISSYPLEAANYTTVLDLLKVTYGAEDQITLAHVMNFLKMPEITHTT